MKLKLISSLLWASLLTAVACAPVEKVSNEGAVGGPVQCVAADWQGYVGQSLTALPQAPEGLVFRVLCNTCAATMDYRPDRVTFTYDEAGIIQRANCG